MEPYFPMTDKAIKEMAQIMSLDFLRKFYETGENYRDGFIYGYRSTIAEAIENMSHEVKNVFYFCQPTVQLIYAEKITQFIDNEKTLEYKKTEREIVIDEHNKALQDSIESMIKDSIIKPHKKLTENEKKIFSEYVVPYKINSNKIEKVPSHLAKCVSHSRGFDNGIDTLLLKAKFFNKEYSHSYFHFLDTTIHLFKAAFVPFLKLYKEGKIPSITPINIQIQSAMGFNKALSEFNDYQNINEWMAKKHLNNPEKVRYNLYEAAILFYILREKEMVKNFSDETLAFMISHLTGHSAQNIRAKGLGKIDDLIKGKLLPKKERNYVNVVRELLDEMNDYISSKSNK